jgi:hypothetical protein
MVGGGKPWKEMASDNERWLRIYKLGRTASYSKIDYDKQSLPLVIAFHRRYLLSSPLSIAIAFIVSSSEAL